MVPNLVDWEIAFLEQIMQRDIRELEMHLPDGEDPSSYLTYLTGVHRKLVALHISRDYPFELTPPLLAPQLSYVRLFNVTLPWDGLTNLRMLSLHGMYRLNLVQILRLLSTSPFLEILELDCSLRIPFDDTPEEDVSFTLVQMAHLTYIRLERMPGPWIIRLLENLSAPACCSSRIITEIDGQFNPLVLAQQVGRLCRPIANSSRMTPCLATSSVFLSLELGNDIMFTLVNSNGWNSARAPGSIDIPKPRLQYDSIHSGFEEFKILDDFFPNIRGLRVTADGGVAQLFQALSKSRETEGGPLEWYLPKLTELEVETSASRSRKAYDGVVDKLIERALVAALSTSTLSSITELTFFRGTVRRESLTKLEELGIQYTLYDVKVKRPHTQELS
ncbi:hypothetical protein FS837_012496 [Tulasnella sp. UAMH 9824]|nr:hypothetical protein FS837_012496 [Tulasnella sp. UAMH 9824]